MFTRATALMAAASSMIGGTLAGLERFRPRQPHHYGQTRYIGGYKGHRSKYDPHQGDREIARRLRQQQRDANRQCDRAEAHGLTGGKVSRRMREMPVLRVAEGETDAR